MNTAVLRVVSLILIVSFTTACSKDYSISASDIARIETEYPRLKERTTAGEFRKVLQLYGMWDKYTEYTCGSPQSYEAGARNSETTFDKCVRNRKNEYSGMMTDIESVVDFKYQKRRYKDAPAHPAMLDKGGSTKFATGIGPVPNDLESLEERIAVEYILLKYLLPDPERGRLVSGHKLWKEYREEYCELQRKLSEGESTASKLIAHAKLKDCYRGLGRERIRRIYVFKNNNRWNSYGDSFPELAKLFSQISGRVAADSSGEPSSSSVEGVIREIVTGINKELGYEKFYMPHGWGKLKALESESRFRSSGVIDGRFGIARQDKIDADIANSIILIDGDTEVSFISNSILISTGDIKLRRVHQSVVIAGLEVKGGKRSLGQSSLALSAQLYDSRCNKPRGSIESAGAVLRKKCD